jgi:hypothetical protein
VIKLDFEKAYDKIHWKFLFEVLQRKGFSEAWIYNKLCTLGEFVLTLMGKIVLPPIRNKCRQFCTSLVQSLYYIPDSYFRSEGVVILELIKG